MRRLAFLAAASLAFIAISDSPVAEARGAGNRKCSNACYDKIAEKYGRPWSDGALAPADQTWWLDCTEICDVKAKACAVKDAEIQAIAFAARAEMDAVKAAAKNEVQAIDVVTRAEKDAVWATAKAEVQAIDVAARAKIAAVQAAMEAELRAIQQTLIDPLEECQ